MPSQAEIEQQQADVDELSAAAVAEMALVVMALTGEDGNDASLLDAIPTLLQKYMATAAGLAVDWYRSLARTTPRAPAKPKPGAPAPMAGPTGRIALLDAQDFQPRPAALPPREQLEATVRWAVYEPPQEPLTAPAEASAPDVRPQRRPAATPAPQPAAAPGGEPQRARVVPAEQTSSQARVIPANETSARAEIIPADANEHQAQIISRLAGATQRYVTTAARDTITENADREGVRWARHAQPTACAFCRLLATRGPDYLTEESAQFVGADRTRGARSKGELYHDDCGCEPVPVRAGDSYEPPDYVEGWIAQYDDAYEAAGGDYKGILAAMRKAEKGNGGSRH